MTKKMIQDIADLLINVGTRKTTSGNYHVDFKDIASAMEIDKQEIIDAREDIMTEIDSREEIISETWLDFDENGVPDGFDMMFGLDYCPNAE